jgi:hypothetical protein
VRALTPKQPKPGTFPGAVEIALGDLSDPVSVAEAIKPYTILRPGYFIQNERQLKPVLTGPGVYPIPAGNQGLAVVDVRDIAEAAAITLGKMYDLVSSEMLSGPDAAAT